MSPTSMATTTVCARRALVRTGSRLYIISVRLYTSTTYRFVRPSVRLVDFFLWVLSGSSDSVLVFVFSRSW